MRLEDFQTIEFGDIKGLYSRGSEEATPNDHLIDCLNIDYELGELRTRCGLTGSITLGYASGKVRRFVNFPTQYGIITLIMDELGNLYTYSARSGDTATTPRLARPQASDFSAIQMLGKIFIGFHNGVNGTSIYNLTVFIPGATTGNDEFRDAAGLAPTAGSPIVAANGAASTVMIAGTYKIAVSYITTSGYITQPGPKIASVFTATTYVSPGAVKINLSNIPIGPSGTAQRQILITKAGGSEYYFIPSANGGLITNNSATTTTLDFNSVTDLQDSADYLFDLKETVSAPLGLQDYRKRLVVYGDWLRDSTLLVSYPDDIESFDAIDGVVPVKKDAGFTVNNAMVIRDILFAFTGLGMYGVIDNDDIPATWEPKDIDRSVTVTVHGIATFYATSNVKLARDWTIIGDHSGLLLMDGSIVKPPLTDKIWNIWKRANKTFFHKLKIAVDEEEHKIYVSLPLDISIENNCLLMGDYNACPGKIPNGADIKWAIWVMKPGGVERGITDIGFAQTSSDATHVLKMAAISGGGKIWNLDSTVQTDDSAQYASYFETALLYKNSGYIHTFAGFKMRITGNGTIVPTVAGLDNKLSATLRTFDIANSIGQEKVVKCNIETERLRWRFTMYQGDFQVGDFVAYLNPKYSQRPA